MRIQFLPGLQKIFVWAARSSCVVFLLIAALFGAVPAFGATPCTNLGSPTYTATSTNSTAITLNDEADPNQGETLSAPEKANSPNYPVSISVPTSGTVTCIQVQLNNISAVSGNDTQALYNTEILLVSPTGHQIVLLSGPGEPNSGVSGLTFLIGDGYNSMPINGGFPTSTSTQTYEPTSTLFDFSLGNPMPSIASPGSGTIANTSIPQTDESATMLGVFSGVQSQGTWSLYVADWIGQPLTIANWTIKLWISQTVVSTSTTISTNTNPAPTSNSVTYTATVTSSSTVNAGTVSFYANGSSSPIDCAQGTAVAVNGSGQAQCTVTLSAGSVSACTTTTPTGGGSVQTLPAFPTVCQGNQSIDAVYSGSGAFATSTSPTLTQVVSGTQSHSGNQWCNTSPISGPNDNTGIAFPSFVSVSGYNSGETVSTVSVNLNGVGPYVDGEFLLVAPGGGGQNLVFMDDAFTSGNSGTTYNLTIEDEAGVYPTGNPSNNGSYGPYNNETLGTFFPTTNLSHAAVSAVPAVPGTLHSPAPFGSSAQTFESNFSGAPANGDWSLYVTAANGAGTFAVSGWCVNLTPNSGVGTTTVVTSGQNPAPTNQSVTYTAAVSPVPNGGAVTFLDNNTTPGGTTEVVNVNTSTGKATFSSSTLYDTIDLGTSNLLIYEGDHTITGAFGGTTGDDASEGSMIERLDDATTITRNGSTYSACNAGPVFQSQGTLGAFTPNPSNIFAAGIPGTISSVTLALNGFKSYNTETINYLESMVEGPTGAALDFFSGTGSLSTQLSSGTYTFSDGAGSTVPQSAFSPGTYKPTSYLSGDTYTSSTSGFYNKPSTFTYSQPHGTGTFTSTFGSTNPNGTWSLFFDMTSKESSIGAASGWCLNFTENAITSSVAESHQGAGTGTDFLQGQTGATLTTAVKNNGPGSSGSAGSNPLKVSDALSTSFTYTGYSGTDWVCPTPTGTAGGTVACTNSDTVASGNSYPTLTLDVSVSSTAPSSITNNVTVSGAGFTQSTPGDTITVDSTPVLAISKSHTGSFTQGSTGQWALTITNTAASGSTSGTVTVTDVLPAGYTMSSYTSTSSLWTCNGGTFVSCTATPGIAAGGTSAITLTVSVPTNSATSVGNTAEVYGGGDLTHANSSHAAVSNTDTVSVVQVPASVVLSSGSGQSTPINTAFANPLIATVADAGGVGVSGQTVTFTAPTGLTPTLKFSNNTNTISAVTNSSGQASSGTMMTANGIPGGPYNVQAAEGSHANNFQLTNLRETLTTIPSLGLTSATIDVFGFGFPEPGGQLAFINAGTDAPVAGAMTLNTATGQTSLTPMVSNSTGANTYPTWTVLGDVNGDGILDLVTSIYETGSVTVQLGNGNGTFQAPTTYLIGSGFGPAEAHLVSLRNNGHLDLIVGSFLINKIAVLLNNGSGAFGTPAFYASGSSKNTAASFTTGDFNHDGYPDVAVANWNDDTVTIMLNNQSGMLVASPTPIPVGRVPQAIRAGDFTGSGYSSLVTANYEDGTVTLLMNNQAGGFLATTLGVGSGVHSGPQALAITGSGSSLLLAVANYKDNTVSVMKGNGSGSFGAQTIVSVGSGPDDLEFADFNGDTIPDLVVTNYLSNNIDLLLGSSGGAYTLVGPFAVGSSPYSSAVGDLNLDGTPDIVTSNCYSSSTGTLLTGTQIVVPYSGLSLPAGITVQATYTPATGSSYGGSTSSATVP